MSETNVPAAAQTAADSGEDLDTGHDYDGIREFDNKLPNWWLATLYLSIVFAIGYWLYFHTLAVGPSSGAEYEMEMAQAASIAAEKAKARGEITDETLVALAGDAGAVDAGKALFGQYCAACHGPEAAGTIGPNLTDDYWLNGKGAPTEIRKIVAAGVPAKGMPGWEQMLGADKVEQLTAFVYTLKGKNVPGKEPQGELASK